MSTVVGSPRPRIWTPRADPLLGRRHAQTWVIDVLNEDDDVIGKLDGVSSGTLDYSIHTQIRSSGSLTVDSPRGIDWHSIRLGIRYEYTDEAGDRHQHPLGVFLPTTPSTTHDQLGASSDVDLYDKMTLLATDMAAATWTAEAGELVADAIAAVLATIGETRMYAPDDGGGTLAATMSFEPGTTKLKIVNEILDAAGFFAIWVDGSGVWRLDPYIPPARRGVSWTHQEGPGAIFEAAFTHEADSWAVPNQVIIVGRSEQDEDGNELPAPYAIARNDDPNDPFSIPRRGRVISLREDDQDATGSQVLAQIAARRLIETSSVTSTYKVTHDFVPLDLNSAVALRMPSAGVEALTVLQAWSWAWEADSPQGTDMVSSTLREVRT